MSYRLGKVHVYVTPSQPATRFVDTYSGKRFWTYRARRCWLTDCCRRRRWAKYVRVRVYYDTIHRFCKDGHGCNAR